MIQYNLTASQLLQTLGYIEDTGSFKLKAFEQEENIKLPSILFEYLSLRYDIDLMKTSDIWNIPYFSYVDIEERIEEDKEYWEEDPENCEGDEFYEFSKMSKEEWPEHVANYLQFGSDYAAGVVNFAICIHDLKRDDPPVYYLHEENSLCDWKLLSETLSEFLIGIVSDVLTCQNYKTAIAVLEKKGWEYQVTEYATYEDVNKELSKCNIDLSSMKQTEAYGRKLVYSNCYDEENKVLYLISLDSNICKVYKIAKCN